jgi:hypothetical protein
LVWFLGAETFAPSFVLNRKNEGKGNHYEMARQPTKNTTE